MGQQAWGLDMGQSSAAAQLTTDEEGQVSSQGQIGMKEEEDGQGARPTEGRI